MFHALTSDSKQQADSTKANPSPQQQNAYATFDGSHALGMPPIANFGLPPVRGLGLPPLRGGGLQPLAAVSPRKQQLMRLQQAYGNQAVLRMLERSRPAIQPKLVVNEPGDAFEQEADRVADQVMRMPDPDLSIAPAPLRVSRKCTACEEEVPAKALPRPSRRPLRGLLRMRNPLTRLP